MKKLLAMALGAMLVVSAMPAFAASAIDFSGYYAAYFFNVGNTTHNNLWHVERWNADGTAVINDWTDTDTFFMNRLNLDITFQPTDEISVVWNLRGPNKVRWGTNLNVNGENAAGFLYSRQIYGKIVQDWGTVMVGRIDDVDHAGLATLGYEPASAGDGYIYRAPFDWADQVDAIYYTNEWDNGFGLRGYYSKRVSQDGGEAFGNGQGGPGWYKDGDYDQIMIEPSYKWDGGGAAFAFWMERNFAGKEDLNPNDNNSAGRQAAWYINPAISHSFGEWSVHAEMMFGWGHNYNRLSDPNNLNSHLQKAKASGYAFYADVDYNYCAGNVNLGGWYASGTSWDEFDKTDDAGRWIGKNKDFVGMGDFAPLLVMFYNQTLGNGRWAADAGVVAGTGTNALDANVVGNFDKRGGGATNGNAGSNQWGLVLGGQHAATDYLTLDWAVGYSEQIYSTTRWQKKVVGTDLTAADTRWAYADTDLGWEIDFGVTIDLLDNLQFSSMFGYMFAGGAFDQMVGWDRTTGNPVIHDADDSYVFVNTLKFSF